MFVDRYQRMPPCGARLGKGGTCLAPAGFATDHEGEGLCRTHGGLAYSVPGVRLLAQARQRRRRRIVRDAVNEAFEMLRRRP